MIGEIEESWERARASPPTGMFGVGTGWVARGRRPVFGALEAGTQRSAHSWEREAMEVEREQLSFERDVRPLFRERDRGAMLGVAKFDLWARDDVAEHSQAILQRLENGSMPCDQAWPDEQVALFRRWVDAGMPA
jgi:hypothetical protein